MTETNYYEVGTIVNTHGIQGEVRVIATTDFPELRFKKGQRLFIQQNHGYLPLEITGHRIHKQFHLLTFKDYQDINLVEPFKGKLLYVAEADQQKLAPNEYYYRDIIGLTILDHETKEPLGKVKEILAPGANDVWVIQRPGQADLLLPFLKSVVLAIDLTTKTALVDVPAGLDD
ncbi:ribosome maturation factor RimM [Lapidilactobacillus achengensis]|uniref:Ribosome maturation factor RimM n=1 Tax=Lapidilactobacillus achengensis TaxID=2486000 RepID=A0ABW1USA6_9LACO|nr:ribosome maturation factor RimM [Lapidilactobacillus achengensis]